jgi:hypothetical protein
MQRKKELKYIELTKEEKIGFWVIVIGVCFVIPSIVLYFMLYYS